MTDNAKWLARLMVDDEVIVQTSHFASPGWLTTVAYFTSTQIITPRALRFQRKTGRGVGEQHSFYSTWLEEPTAERRDTIRHHALVDGLKQICWTGLPLATLEAVLDLVTKAAIEAKR